MCLDITLCRLRSGNYGDGFRSDASMQWTRRKHPAFVRTTRLSMFDRNDLAAKGDPEHFKNQIPFKDVIAFLTVHYTNQGQVTELQWCTLIVQE